MATDIGPKIGLDGEAEFRKALQAISTQAKTMASEMKAVTSEFDKNDTSQEKLTKQTEVLNRQIENQKAKLEMQKQALEASREKFGDADAATQKWQKIVYDSTADLNRMEHELKDAESAMGDYGDETEKAAEQTEDAKAKFADVAGTVAEVGKAIAAAAVAIGAAAVAAGKEIWDMANATAEAGDEIEKNSQKVGLSFESYQKWDYAMQLAGTSMSSCTTGLKTLTNTFDDAQNGSAGAIQKFERLGLSLDDLKGKSREEIFSATVAALQNVSDETERAALANDMFGKSGQDLLPLLNQSTEATQALLEEAEQYGMVMSDDAVKASAAFQDSLSKMKGTMNGLKNSIVGELLPGITQIMDGFSDLVSGNENAGEEIKAGVESVIETVTGMIPEAVSIITTIAEAILENAPSIIQALAQGIIDAIPQLLPVVTAVVIDLINTLALLLPEIINAGMQILISLAQGIAEAVPTLIPQIVLVVTQIVQTLVDNLPQLLNAALQLITGLAQGILDAIPVLVDALPAIITGIVDFLLGSIPEIIDAGIQLLTSLVDALPEIIEAIVDAIPEIIEGIITALMNNIPAIVDAGIRLLTSLIQNLPKIILTIVQSIPKIISSIVSTLAGNNGNIAETGIKLFTSLVDGLSTILIEIGKAVIEIALGIIDGFNEYMDSFGEIGENIVRGLWEGITSLAQWLWDNVSGWISGIWDGICDFFGIHSPSREMAWIGQMLVTGLSDSIDRYGDDAVAAAEEMSENVLDAMPNYADAMAQSMDASALRHADLIDQMSGGVNVNLTGGADTLSTGVNMGGVTIVVNAAQGQDENAIADAVMWKIENLYERRGRVFA